MKSPLSVTIPRKGDKCYMASDACASLPAARAKLFIERPGVPGFLPSFNFGFRIKVSMAGWSPCELEALILNKAVAKFKFFFKMSGCPAVALVDSKATYEAKLKLDMGEFSNSKRLLSAERISVQHISARLPSPILTMVDFDSQNPIECCLKDCTICDDINHPDPVFFCAVKFGAVNALNPAMIPKSVWRDIQEVCPVLAKTFNLLRVGKPVHKKETGQKLKDVRKYMSVCSLNKDGLIIIKTMTPFENKPSERIVIPRYYARTLAKCLFVC